MLRVYQCFRKFAISIFRFSDLEGREGIRIINTPVTL
jgi:hypothetical protein